MTMRNSYKKIFNVLRVAICLSLVFVTSGNNLRAEQYIKKDLRGVWVSTVYSLDYPSVKTVDCEVLKRDIDSIISNVKSMGMNAIFFQVRPASDALYKSDYFPWSKFLTGRQGEAPKNNFDPFKR